MFIIVIESIEEMLVKSKLYLLQGDKEFSLENFQHAHEYYRKAHDCQTLYFSRMDSRNSKIYLRLAQALWKIGDDKSESNYPILTEAKFYT